MPDTTLEQAVRILMKTAHSAIETGHTEAEVVAGNWDILGPMLLSALEDRADLSELIRAVVDSASDDGCSDDLTVASKSAIEALAEYAGSDG